VRDILGDLLIIESQILRRNMTNIISLLKHGCALLCGAHTTVASTDKIMRMVGAFFAHRGASVSCKSPAPAHSHHSQPSSQARSLAETQSMA